MTALKQTVKKYCLTSDKGLHDLTDQINNFCEKFKVDEVISMEFFQEQYGDHVKTTEKGENNNGYINNSKTTISTYYWKYSVIITILREENVESRLS